MPHASWRFKQLVQIHAVPCTPAGTPVVQICAAVSVRGHQPHLIKVLWVLEGVLWYEDVIEEVQGHMQPLPAENASLQLYSQTVPP